MGWGSCWLVVHSHPQATKDQQHRKRWWHKSKKVNMLYFCGSEDGFQEEKPGIFFVAHVEMPLLFFPT